MCNEGQMYGYRQNHEFSNEEMEFEYRHSRLSDSEYIVLEAEISLTPGRVEDIMEKIMNNEKRIEAAIKLPRPEDI